MKQSIIAYAIEAHAKTNHLYDGHPYYVHYELGRIFKFRNTYQLEKQKGKTEVEALLVVYKTELERHIEFSLTDQIRDEILDIFKQGIHSAYTD